MTDADKLGIIDAYESKLWELITEPDTQVAEALDVIELCQRVRAGLQAEQFPTANLPSFQVMDCFCSASVAGHVRGGVGCIHQVKMITYTTGNYPFQENT